jgi:transcriptional regulator with XRE-family HTH domain
MTAEAINRQIGRKIGVRRHELGLTLAQVAEKCGVTLQQIHKYETSASVISAPMLWRLSKCLGVPVGYFFEGLER